MDQNTINILFAVALLWHVIWSRNPTVGKITCKGNAAFNKISCDEITCERSASFDKIICNGLKVVDAAGKLRLDAGVFCGTTRVQWFIKNEKPQISVSVDDDGSTSVMVWLGFPRGWRSLVNIAADGTVILPTEDLIPPKKP